MEILELKSTKTEMENSLERLNSRFELTEERTSKLEGRLIEFMQSKKQMEKKMKKKPEPLLNMGHD